MHSSTTIILEYNKVGEIGEVRATTGRRHRWSDRLQGYSIYLVLWLQKDARCVYAQIIYVLIIYTLSLLPLSSLLRNNLKKFSSEILLVRTFPMLCSHKKKLISRVIYFSFEGKPYIQRLFVMIVVLRSPV